jgi:serine/threonine-protein kinase ULK4
VAVKSVDKSLKARVLNEVSVLYTLDHPNVLKFIGWYETTKVRWLRVIVLMD